MEPPARREIAFQCDTHEVLPAREVAEEEPQILLPEARRDLGSSCTQVEALPELSRVVRFPPSRKARAAKESWIVAVVEAVAPSVPSLTSRETR